MLRDREPYLAAARQLKERREAAKLTVPQMASRLGVSPARYRTWEKLFGPDPQRQYGDAVARILGAAESSPPPLSRPDLAVLGHRAQGRRRDLRLSRRVVAAALDIGPTTLQSWELELPATRRDAIEETWESVLEVPRGWLRDATLEVPGPSRPVLDLSAHGATTVSGEILEAARYLVRRPTVARSAALSPDEERKALMFAQRYGTEGPEHTALQVIGDRFGLTRERVRQIVETMLERVRGLELRLPALARLKDAAAEAGNLSVEEFESTYAELLAGVSLADADRFSRDVLGLGIASLGEKQAWQLSNPVRPMVSGSDGQELANATRSAAVRMVRSCGAAHILFLAGMVAESLGKAVSVSDVRQALRAVEGVEWVANKPGWFWLGPDRANSRVLDAVRKVLAVAGKADVEELHRAVCRSRRRGRVAGVESPEDQAIAELEITQEVLREILCKVPWLDVHQRNDFLLKEDLRVEDVLSDSEIAVMRAIEEHGGAVTRRALQERFVDTGVFSSPNLQALLSHSPVTCRLARGVYGLRGRDVPPRAYQAAVEAVLSRAGGASTPLLDADGYYEFGLRLSEAGLKNRIVDIPLAVARGVPAGDYLAEGLLTGAFSIGLNPAVPGRARRLATLMKNAGVRPGEVLRFRLDPVTRRVLVSRAEPAERHPAPASELSPALPLFAD